ncbi:MAG: GTP 3',8-cyclase MoaA [Anaerolineae bacterium]
MPLLDPCRRTINYMRISVTDRCNLRCTYCMPPQGVAPCAHEEILRYEEIARVVSAAAALGISRIRLTGGEPLVRAGIVDLVAQLARIPGITDLSMTTNGVLLPRYAKDLVEAGLTRVNISLDTLKPERYAMMTRLGKLDDALAGIAAAEAAGLRPIKINTVVLGGVNEDELADMAALTLRHDWQVRFIELMPLNGVVEHPECGYLSTDAVRARIAQALGPLEPVEPPVGGGPADAYRLSGALGTLGFISPVSHHFCERCNRLRLTADGRLRPCLLENVEYDVKPLLRGGADEAALQEAIRTVVQAKPRGHHLEDGQAPRGRTMSEIGG